MQSIDSYRKAYQADPDGPLAAAALYGLARYYLGLAEKSYLQTDRIQAVKTYEDLIRRFPDVITSYSIHYTKLYDCKNNIVR